VPPGGLVAGGEPGRLRRGGVAAGREPAGVPRGALAPDGRDSGRFLAGRFRAGLSLAGRGGCRGVGFSREEDI